MSRHITGTSSVYSIKKQLKRVEAYFLNKHVNKNKAEVAFAISLKSKIVSRNWNNVQSNLAKTLRSILNNTDSHFRVIVAGHEKPDIKEIRHKRVTWLPVNFPPPSNQKGFSRDKMRKRKVIGEYLRKIGFSGYFMPFDSDDWAHHRLVQYVRSQPTRKNFVIDTGMMINLVKKEVWLRKKRFYIGCGSSAVFYFANKDFPLTPETNNAEKKPFHLVLKAHPKVIQNLRTLRRPCKIVKFPLVTWVLGHGDNNSMLKGKKNNTVSAEDYGSKGEKLENAFFHYFKARKNQHDA
ncbi:hypothetical protein E0485_01375 [Paenibacillus albiflavus]|uniref:Glycosyltransferase family 2 protein n=1 Tax=Paenibacillus albiflavus TaxID=2545760 RepID=A0A4R4EN05_9BACL|nr:hypothetical protein [Paenibacillus albiflavus]TCZ80963.1 hypothetical protein E0485_01375 [Paenibacillus albiflavus]